MVSVSRDLRHVREPVARDQGVETLSQIAYRSLRTDILNGVRSPGERLRLERLKGIYGIGPTPLREALRMLAADSLVVAEGNRGFTVARLDPRELKDLNIARIGVETTALRLSMENGDTAWEAGVVAASYMMAKEDEALMRSGGTVPDRWEQTNADFHLSLVAACGSRTLLAVRSDLQDKFSRYRRISVQHEPGGRDYQEEHTAISRAVLARDIDLACTLTEHHFARTANRLYDTDACEDET